MAMLTSEEHIAELLKNSRTIALTIASPKTHRDSNKILRFLLDEGYDVYPVNPSFVGTEIHGRQVYASLEEIPIAIDIVDIFRRSDCVGPIVEAAIESGARAIWMQLGVINLDAAQQAQEAGLSVVMDRCPAIDIPKFRSIGLM